MHRMGVFLYMLLLKVESRFDQKKTDITKVNIIDLCMPLVAGF